MSVFPHSISRTRVAGAVQGVGVGGGLAVPLARAKAKEAVTAAAGSLASGEISPGNRVLHSAGPHHSNACRCN